MGTQELVCNDRFKVQVQVQVQIMSLQVIPPRSEQMVLAKGGHQELLPDWTD